jgi:hypothetical protein
MHRLSQERLCELVVDCGSLARLFLCRTFKVLRPAAGGATSIAGLMLVRSFGFLFRSGSGFVSDDLFCPFFLKGRTVLHPT